MASFPAGKTASRQTKEPKMPKMKTKSAVKKRFSLTGSGKVKVKVGYKSHLLSNKGTKMKRHARGTFVLCDADEKIIKKFMPYG
jgi:large subunit ribosomal protein L35